VPPYPFPRVLDTLQTRPEILSNSKRDENDGTSRFGWREWRSQPFLHGKLIVVEPFMSVNFLEHRKIGSNSAGYIFHHQIPYLSNDCLSRGRFMASRHIWEMIV
jgi:hypothetical protein